MDFKIEAIHYFNGGEHHQETATVDIMWEDGKDEHISGSVDGYISGITLKSCVNGEVITFSIQQQISVLEFILTERLKFINSRGKKTCSAWHDTVLNFCDYCFPGDVVDDEMVNYFVDCMPPITLRRSCTQHGEPHSTEADESGVYKETYITFRREDGKWIFDGYCFAGENVNRDTKGSYLERALKMLKAIPTTMRLTLLGVDSHGRNVYKDEREQLWKNSGGILYSSCNNSFYGEPDCPMRKGIEIEYVGEA